MEEQLSLEFLRVSRTARFRGPHHEDSATATSGRSGRGAMRKNNGRGEMDGTIVIGEGDRDEAPSFYIGEKVGLATTHPKRCSRKWKLRRSLEGTNLCATGAAGAIAVLAASEKGGLLQHAPDSTWKKSGGSVVQGRGRTRCSVATIESIAKRLDRDVEDLVIHRPGPPAPRKADRDIRKAGARIRLIGDGDLSAGFPPPWSAPAFTR